MIFVLVSIYIAIGCYYAADTYVSLSNTFENHVDTGVKAILKTMGPKSTVVFFICISMAVSIVWPPIVCLFIWSRLFEKKL